jgi:Tol biopolymer transport system component
MQCSGNVLLIAILFAVGIVAYGDISVVMPSGTITLAPVQTLSVAATAIAQPASWDPTIYPSMVRVIAPQDGKYGLFGLGDNSKLLYGPAELDPKSLAVSWDGYHTVMSIEQGNYFKLCLLVEDYSGNRLLPLTDGPGNDRFPTLAPDKSFLAFISDRDGHPKLYGLPIDRPELVAFPGGARPIPLFPGPGEERAPAFSEHGLAFLSNLMGTWDLWVLEGPDYSSPRRVIAGVDPDSPVAWVGDTIFVVKNRTPGLVSQDGRFFRPLSGGPQDWWKRSRAPKYVVKDGIIYSVKFPAPLSPDLAFFRTNKDGTTALWLVTLDGKKWKVADQVPVGEAAWSPDGTRLAYLRRGKRVAPLPGKEAGYRPDWYELWIADADGTDAHCIRVFSPYGGEYEAHSLAWGPGGDRLFFALAEVGTPVYELHSVRLDGSGLKELFGGVYTCDVHPNGVVTGVARGPYLYSYDITSDTWTSYWEFGQLWDVSFSPSAKYAVAMTDGALVLLDCTTRTERVLLPKVEASAGTQPYSPPAWSPDEKRFAYVSDWDGDSEIWIYDLASGTKTQITANDCDDYSPAWSPDGDYIAYVSEEDVFPAIRIFSVEDGKTWSITDGEYDDARPIWRNGRCD